MLFSVTLKTYRTKIKQWLAADISVIYRSFTLTAPASSLYLCITDGTDEAIGLLYLDVPLNAATDRAHTIIEVGKSM